MITFSGTTSKNTLEYRVEITISYQPINNRNIPVYGLKFSFIDGTYEVCDDITDSFDDISELYRLFLLYDIDKKHIYDVIEDHVAQMHFYN